MQLYSVLFDLRRVLVSKLVDNGKDATFSIFDSFREGDEHGPPKIGFGYGLKNGRKVNIYTQQDPCPCKLLFDILKV